jgi:hypothetical protein
LTPNRYNFSASAIIPIGPVVDDPQPHSPDDPITLTRILAAVAMLAEHHRFNLLKGRVGTS